MSTIVHHTPKPTTSPNISATELRMGGRYSIRKPGMTAWATCETIAEARRQLKVANRSAGDGHKLIDNRTGEEKA